jgi:hypothetical protein
MRRHNRYPRRNGGTGFSVFIFVIILAVAFGYAGTKYIIYPYLLGNDGSKTSGGQNSTGNTVTNTAIDTVTSKSGIIIDQQNLKNDTQNNQSQSNGTPTGTNGNQATGTIAPASENLKGPFSVQFGSFSTKTGADSLTNELSGKGIYSYAYESNGSYKVLGLPYSSEGKAKEAAAVASAVVPDVFVVNLSALIN